MGEMGLLFTTQLLKCQNKIGHRDPLFLVSINFLNNSDFYNPDTSFALYRALPLSSGYSSFTDIQKYESFIL